MTPEQERMYRRKYNLKSAAAPYIIPCPRVGGFARGQRVRCHFGTEHRDGLVEHVARNGAVHVRINAGWVHCVSGDELDSISSLEFVPTDAGVLP